MPFASKRQQRAAFGGYIPDFSKKKAKEWADETDFSSLPDRAPSEKGKPTLKSKKASRAGAAKKAVSLAAALGRRPVRKGISSVHRFNREHGVYQRGAETAEGVYEKLKHSHFMKIADLLMGMGQGAGQVGENSSSADKAIWDVPNVKSRGSGYQTPPRPKKPGADIKKQAVNPRKNLRDAMTQGIA